MSNFVLCYKRSMIDTNIFQNKTAAYYTLGCKLNFAETSTLAKQLEELGVRKARTGECADICIVNTCSVTELADKKCRQTIRKIARRNPRAFIVVTGCYAQLKPEEIAEQIPEVDLILGAEQKLDLLLYLGDLQKRDKARVATTPTKDIKRFSPSCSRGDRTRYFLKVQDGCDYFCTYCTIPFARGRSRSGTIEQLTKQAHEVAQAGGKEIVITGVNIGDFGKQTGENFLDLIRSLDEVEGIEHYRISSIEPNLLTDEIIAFVAQSQRFAPHFHIPLQSGSDTILKLMHRHYDTALFAHKIAKIRQMIPDAFIGVDLITGVRGETEALFEESRRFVESLDISQLHVFTYSERAGTQALKIGPIIPIPERHDRCRRMLEISDKKLHDFYQRFQETTRPVLFEQPRKGAPMHGFTDNYIRVEMPYRKEWINTCHEVKLGAFNQSGDALLSTEI